MNAQTCAVSFLDPDGIGHAITVGAETLYEAAVRAIRTVSKARIAPAPASPLMIEVQPPAVMHTITLTKVQEWLESSAKSPSDKITKERLKGLLAR